MDFIRTMVSIKIKIGLLLLFTFALFFTLASLADTATVTSPIKKNSDLFIKYPRPYYAQDPTRNQLIKRGEYLSKAGDCIACHTDTKHNGPAFAGGLAIYTPFGTIYSP